MGGIGGQRQDTATARTAGQTLPVTAPKHAGMALRTLRYLPGGCVQVARAGAHLTVSPRASVETLCMHCCVLAHSLNSWFQLLHSVSSFRLRGNNESEVLSAEEENLHSQTLLCLCLCCIGAR